MAKLGYFHQNLRNRNEELFVMEKARPSARQDVKAILRVFTKFSWGLVQGQQDDGMRQIGTGDTVSPVSPKAQLTTFLEKMEELAPKLVQFTFKHLHPSLDETHQPNLKSETAGWEQRGPACSSVKGSPEAAIVEIKKLLEVEIPLCTPYRGALSAMLFACSKTVAWFVVRAVFVRLNKERKKNDKQVQYHVTAQAIIRQVLQSSVNIVAREKVLETIGLVWASLDSQKTPLQMGVKTTEVMPTTDPSSNTTDEDSEGEQVQKRGAIQGGQYEENTI